MESKAYFLLVVLAVSVALPYMSTYHAWNAIDKDEFYFGVTYGFNSTAEAKLLIDKVKPYTNLFVVDSWDLTTNESILNEVCDYAATAGLKFIVYFDLISQTTYPWHQDWFHMAQTRWGDRFLGIYLHDELGGKQIDDKRYFTNASDYRDAANRFVTNIVSYYSNQFAKNHSIPIFTSDYVLYWWDYLGGYDTVFAELGWNHSTTQQIAFCRGAANTQDKDWGAIITWKYDDPPYLGSYQEIFNDMLAAYKSGAKYVVVFNYPKYPETNPYGILNEDYFVAMKNFYNYIKAYPRTVYGGTEGQVAMVLPENYGWGARRQNDNIWGLWPADDKAPLIWENMNKLIMKYGFELDIIFYDARFPPKDKYSEIYFWNATIA